MLEYTRARQQFIRRRLAVPRALAAALAVTLLAAQLVGGLLLSGRGPAAMAAPSISQIYFTPYEAQEYMGILRGIAGDPGCCSGPLLSTISITSGATGNAVVYDHFEDGYEIDPYNPVQGSTVTLSLDDGDVWTQTSSIPVDQPGRGAGFFYDGRDRIVSSAPIAVTQTAYATTPGSLHAGAVEVLDLDKSGTAFDIPVGQNADYNSVFEYVGLMIVANQRGTTVQVDADANGSFETTAALDEGDTHLIGGGVRLGARVTSDHPVAVYVLTGDVGATYEGRDFELYPTAVWTSQVVSPVGARSTDDADGTRVFLFNPGSSAVVVDVATSAGAAGTVNLAARGQGSYRMPVNEGARFTARGGVPIYAFQAITTEGSTATSSYDWGFSLIPVNAATTSVIVPYAPGSAGLTNNYSPVWVTTFANTTLYVDRDGDRSTGANVDPLGGRYDFSCAVTGLRSYTIYDDGTSNCYRPDQNSAAGGDRDMTGARIYTVNQTRLVSAWGQRSSYVAGSPALDVGTTILPFPSISMAKSSAIVADGDGDGRADPGDTVAYTISMTNLGIIDVGSVLLTDEVPDYSGYVAGSTTLDGVPQADNSSPYSPSPVDAASPAGGLVVGTIAAGATRTAVFRVVVDNPLPFGVGSLLNLATMTTSLGNASAANLLPLDAGLRIDKAATPGPVDPGDTIDYTIRVFNGTPVQQTGVSLADTLPAGVTFVPGSAAGDLSGTPVVVGAPPNLASGLTMPRGSVLTVTFRATVNDPLPPGTSQLVNAAATSSDQTPGPITDTAVTAVAQAPQPVVTKTPAPASLPEPGGTVTFTVTVGNTSAAAVTLVSLMDDVFGDLRDPANPAVANNTCPAQPAVIPAGGTLSCSFDAAVAGDAGDPSHTDTVTATVQDGDGRPGTGRGTATVPFTDVFPAITVAKSPGVGAVPEPGGMVTFSVVVGNLSVEAVTLTGLADDVFGDLRDPANPAVSANTCPAQPAVIPVGGALSCSFDAFVYGDAEGPDHVDTVSATAADDEGNPASAGDDATVALTDVLPLLSVSKTPSVGSVGEPGGMVTFSVAVGNLSVEAVTLSALADDVFGDLRDPANPAVANSTCPAQPAVIPVDGTFSCSFEAFVAGDAGDPAHVDTVTATAADNEGNPASGGDDATVAFGDTAPSLAISKTPSTGSVLEPGGTVTFSVVVENLSVEAVTLVSLVDDVFGDLRFAGNPAVANNTCPAQPAVIPVGGTLSCSFDAFLAGDAEGPDHHDTVTVSATDDEGNRASAADDATVAFGDVLPSVSLSKTPSAGSVAEPGATVTFTIGVRNTSAEAVTLTSLSDDVFGDLRDPANPAVSANTCPAQAAIIGPGGTFACSFDAFVAGGFGDPDHVDTVVAAVADDEGNPASGSDDARVSFGGTAPAVDVSKSATPGSVLEPGAIVTFSIEAENLSVEAVTLTSLSDDVFGDLLDAANPAVADNTCPAQPAAIPVGGTFACSFDAFVAADAGSPPHADTVTAAVVDDDGETATDIGRATVTFADVLPVITTAKSPSVGAVAEPGAVVSFAVRVANGSVEEVALSSLVDDVFGDLLDPANPAVASNTCPAQPLAVPVGGTFSCSFDAFVSGGFGDPAHTDTVTALARDDEGNPAAGSDDARVAFTDVLPAVGVTKSAAPGSVPEPGATVAFTVAVANRSVEAVTVTSLTDDVFGDLLDPANPAVAANTCPAQPAVIPVGGTLACSFDAFVAGDAEGPDHLNTAIAAATDDDGNLAIARDDATVSFTDVLPSATAAKTPSVGSVAEPGGIVSFAIEVGNTSMEEVTMSSLTDDVFGDLLDPANPAVSANTCPAQPAVIPVGGVFACSFAAFVAGDAGDPAHHDTVTARVADDDGNRTSAADDATVAFGDVLPSISTLKTPSAGTVPEPGATVTFTVSVSNTSVEAVTLGSLVDDVFGDLRFPGNPAVSANTCPAQPAVIPVSGSLTCSFAAFVAGDAGDPAHRNTVTAAVTDALGNPASDGDDALVGFSDVAPSIAAAKTPSAGSVPEPGGTVTFTIGVANTSAEAVTLTGLADSAFGNLLDPTNPAVSANTCPAQPARIGVGGTFACSFAAFVAGEAGDPAHHNTVTAQAIDDEGTPASDDDDATVAFGDLAPAIDVAKTADPGMVPEPGGTVTFTVTVANVSAEAVTLTSLSDDVFGDLLDPVNPAVAANTCPTRPTALPAHGSFTCSFRALVEGESGDPAHHDTVTATVVDDEGNRILGADDARVTFGDTLPAVDVAKQAAVGAVPEPGGMVLFGVTVRNTSAEGVVLTALTDSVFGNLRDPANPAVSANTCPARPAAIPAGGTFSCSFEALVVGDAGGPDHVNIVRAVVSDDEGGTASGADDATVAFSDALPAIGATKTPSAAAVAEPGGAVSFRVVVENLSAETVTLVSLADDVFGNLLDRDNPALSANTCPAQPFAIPPAGSLSCSFTAFVAGDAGDPAHRDTVTARVADDEGNPASAAASAGVAFADLLPSVSVSKTPSAGSVPEPGGGVTFAVVVGNTAVEPITLTSLVDSVFGDLLDPANPRVSANSCPAAPRTMARGGAFSCSFSALVAGDAGDPDHHDTVTAVAADDEGNVAVGADDAAVAFGDLAPTIDVAKSAAPGVVAEPGAAVTFTVTVANTSVEALTLARLTDSVFGDLRDPENGLVTANTCPAQPAAIPVGGSFSCSFDAFVEGDAGGPDHHDTVAAEARDDEGNPAVGEDDATVAFSDSLPGLRVTKTAAPSAVGEPGGIVGFNVTVENTSVEPVTLTSLLDSVFGDLRDAENMAVWENTCPAQPAAIPEGGTFSCSFEALVTGEFGGPDHVNTVTAAAVDDEGNPASAGDAATIAFLETHALVAGHFFVDLDGDGRQGPGEPNLPGVQVRLIDGAGHRITVTGDALGNWGAEVPAGVVSMRVVAASVPAGYRLTTGNATQTVEAPPGSMVYTTDVGYQPADGSLAGKVFFDVDGNDSQGPGEPPFAGVAVALYDGERLVRTVLTGADGSYRFDGLAPGTYTVVVRDGTDLFSGFRATLDPDGALDGETETVLEVSEDRAGLDFAYRGSGSVGDTIWNDADADGVQDPSEDPIAGIVVDLVWSGFDGFLGSADDVRFPSLTTGAGGVYLFAGVPAGVIGVAVDDDSVGDDLEPTTTTSYDYDLSPGENYLEGDIGYRTRQELPNTGFDADRLGFLSLGLITLGLVLLLLGRRGRGRERLRWERIG